MIYESGLPGQWVNFMEVEAVFDRFRARIDWFENWPGSRDSVVMRTSIRAERDLLDDLEKTLQGMARVGMMCAAIPVYNLGIVDRPGEVPRPRGSEAGAAGEPLVENWGGDSR